MERTILHVDLNAFYASVECLYNPEIREKPVAVCGSVEERHGIVLTANYIAKRGFHVKTGEAVWEAKQKCPGLVVVPPHYDLYMKYSGYAREMYNNYTPCVESFGLDECWLDLTGTEHLWPSGEWVANELRRRMVEELGLTVSVGVSFNKIFAKLGSDMKKPDGLTVIRESDFQRLVWPLPVSDLLYVGHATTAKLNNAGIVCIGDLARTPVDYLSRLLGKWGRTLWEYANGLDDSVVSLQGNHPEDKSVGNSKTFARDLVTLEDIHIGVNLMAESVAERMMEAEVKCQVVNIYLRLKDMFAFERQKKLPFPTCTAHKLSEVAMGLVEEHWNGTPLRGLGIRGTGLVPNEFRQFTLYPDEKADQKQEDIERTVKDLRDRYGGSKVFRGMMQLAPELDMPDHREEGTAHSVAFFRKG